MQKILVIRNDRFGEFLLNIPALRAVKESFPRAKVHVAVAAGVKELAAAVPFVDKVIVLLAEGQSPADLVKIVFQLRRERYDAAVVLNPAARAHQLLWWAGIPLRVGYARKHPFFLTHTVDDVKALGRKHEVENNLDLIALLGCRTKDTSLVIDVPAAVEAEVVRKWGLDPAALYVAVHPWTSDPVKQWLLGNFEHLVTRLAENSSRRVIIIGRPESWHLSFSVPALPGIIDLRGQTTLIEAAAILKHCAVLVSCDSGPVHLAASVGTPVVALFRNDMPGKSPERWGPWPAAKHQVIQKLRIEDITVDDVLDKLRVFFE